ncbi:hypothetical protein BY996DRAFT_7073093 [Phakopsora pachyrhizi]|nr:hypothetical protein BY996DRAFT_7073093 [Phakopsora pachyrhizi]
MCHTVLDKCCVINNRNFRHVFPLLFFLSSSLLTTLSIVKPSLSRFNESSPVSESYILSIGCIYIYIYIYLLVLSTHKDEKYRE